MLDYFIFDKPSPLYQTLTWAVLVFFGLCFYFFVKYRLQKSENKRLQKENEQNAKRLRELHDRQTNMDKKIKGLLSVPDDHLIRTYCQGYNVVGEYRTTQGSTYTRTIRVNSEKCGYIDHVENDKQYYSSNIDDHSRPVYFTAPPASASYSLDGANYGRRRNDTVCESSVTTSQDTSTTDYSPSDSGSNDTSSSAASCD